MLQNIRLTGKTEYFWAHWRKLENNGKDVASKSIMNVEKEWEISDC